MSRTKPGCSAGWRRRWHQPRSPRPSQCWSLQDTTWTSAATAWWIRRANRFRSRTASSLCCASSCGGQDGCCPANNFCSCSSGRGAEAYDRSIDMQVVRLRRKIEPDRKHPSLIVTIPNSGYKFAAKVRQAEAAALAEPAVTPMANPAGAERRYVTALAAEVLAADGTEPARRSGGVTRPNRCLSPLRRRRHRPAWRDNGSDPGARDARLFRLSGGAGTRRRACAPHRSRLGGAFARGGHGASRRTDHTNGRGQRPRGCRPKRRVAW